MNVGAVIRDAEQAWRDLRLDELVVQGVEHVDAELFFPAITYPPLCELHALSQAESDVEPAKPGALMCGYIHIPFCRTRCTFCHWVVLTGSSDEAIDTYLDHLEREMVLHKSCLGVDRLAVSSLLIGGGTPSSLSPRQIERFMQIIHRHYDLSRCRQFSYEPEPSTLLDADGPARLKILRAHGVNRVSMGVQSFDDALLRQLGRNHTAAQGLQAIERIREAGIDSISIDLIYGLPEQSLEAWVKTLQTAVRSGADAWQLYRLRILPHGDRPGKVVEQYQRAASRFPTVSDVLLMKKIGIMVSRDNGFPERYTRIFAREDRHISYYLHDVNARLSDIVGAGVSAWSNFGRTFTLNIGNNLPLYYEHIAQGRMPFDRGLVRSADDEMRRSFILPLKNARVDKRAFAAKNGVTVAAAFGARVAHLERLGLLTQNDEEVRLTSRGRFCADEIAFLFFAPQHVPRREFEAVTVLS